MQVDGERAAIIRTLRGAGGEIRATLARHAGGNAASILRDRLARQYPDLTVKRLTGILLRGLERDGYLTRDLGARGTYTIRLTRLGEECHLMRPSPPRPSRPLPKPPPRPDLAAGYYVIRDGPHLRVAARTYIWDHRTVIVVAGPYAAPEALQRRGEIEGALTEQTRGRS